jgi:hypothetical protein
VKLEEPSFRLWIKPGLSAEEWAEAAHAIARILVDPPRPVAERRRVAVRTALAQYEGPVSRRAKQLADRYRSYLAGAWLRERDLENLPHPRSTQHLLLHRIARCNGGRCTTAASSTSRRLFHGIEPLCNFSRLMLHK